MTVPVVLSNGSGAQTQSCQSGKAAASAARAMAATGAVAAWHHARAAVHASIRTHLLCHANLADLRMAGGASLAFAKASSSRKSNASCEKRPPVSSARTTRTLGVFCLFVGPGRVRDCCVFRSSPWVWLPSCGEHDPHGHVYSHLDTFPAREVGSEDFQPALICRRDRDVHVPEHHVFADRPACLSADSGGCPFQGDCAFRQAPRPAASSPVVSSGVQMLATTFTKAFGHEER